MGLSAIINRMTLAGVALVTGIAATEARAQPVIWQNGLAHAADWTHKLGANGIGGLFGDFKPKDCPGYAVLNDQQRRMLATKVCGGEVRFNGVAMPIFYAGAHQYNIQLPATAGAYDVTVVEDGVASAPVRFDIAPEALGVFRDANSLAVVQNALWELMTYQSPLRPNHPNIYGQFLVFYHTGGRATNPFPTGEFTPAVTSPSDPLYTIKPVTLKIGDLIVSPDFQGLTPGCCVALGQTNVRIPNLATGAYPLITGNSTDGTLTTEEAAPDILILQRDVPFVAGRAADIEGKPAKFSFKATDEHGNATQGTTTMHGNFIIEAGTSNLTVDFQNNGTHFAHTAKVTAGQTVQEPMILIREDKQVLLDYNPNATIPAEQWNNVQDYVFTPGTTPLNNLQTHHFNHLAPDRTTNRNIRAPEFPLKVYAGYLPPDMQDSLKGCPTPWNMDNRILSTQVNTDPTLNGGTGIILVNDGFVGQSFEAVDRFTLSPEGIITSIAQSLHLNGGRGSNLMLCQLRAHEEGHAFGNKHWPFYTSATYDPYTKGYIMSAGPQPLIEWLVTVPNVFEQAVTWEQNMLPQTVDYNTYDRSATPAVQKSASTSTANMGLAFNASASAARPPQETREVIATFEPPQSPHGVQLVRYKGADGETYDRLEAYKIVQRNPAASQRLEYRATR